MSSFRSRISTSSESFTSNRRQMLDLIGRLNELNDRAASISGKRKSRFERRGQILPRERLARILDPGMPFVTIGNLTGYMFDTDDEAASLPGATTVCGIGFIRGVRCAIVVDDSAIQAGALTTATMNRILRIQQIAMDQKLPFIHLVESAGANLLEYKVTDFLRGGGLFANLARLSAMGLPVISILHGSSTAGGAYMPGLSDYVIAVKSNGKAFLAGPPLLKAATGEIATDEELGGAQMHATVSGLVDYLAEDDKQACAILRKVVAGLGWNRLLQRAGRRTYAPPIYDPDEIAGIVPVDYRTPYDCREVIARLVDGSDLAEFKPGYGVTTICARAELCGYQVALLGNNGPIDPDGATKAGQFLQLQDQADIPVIFLQNTTGFLVGRQYERAGMIKHGSKMIQAVTNIRVPRFTFLTGASFGAGNYGMCGRGYDPDFIFSWPNASIAVMGGDQAAMVMSIVAEARATSSGEQPNQQELLNLQDRIREIFRSQSSAFYVSGLMLDDGMIDPRDTRKTAAFLLETTDEAQRRELKANAFGVARL